ncbi:tripartite tricarboxylate transporter permease [Ectothiorhodospira lacustris]|uniref:tripartite tricarboxylate transporter permease n=1 Tax=Ectothiorhodospira lacustris TaxID=2899127 RepID=UPI001EE842AC|nr:tripartite tricarboxylate transporter permease [Ectothiorhodospira lacustris]MCG5501332.1 tripartite tricarboxylate transporter permease [Ectothiorhodospira lacustris]
MELMTLLLSGLQPIHLLTLVAGIGGGLLLGAMPGISPTLSVALLVPFTFHLPADTSLILLGSVYAASIAGGAISAILINVPGAPANVATTFDGYPMARAGKAQEALQVAFTSTLVGGMAGMLVLIFLAPVAAPLALAFGPAEMFWVAVLGITVLASMGTGSVVKGLFAGAFGIWISMIGISTTTGTHRFVFADFLEGGIHIVVALIGLFAIPQVLALLASDESRYQQGPRRRTPSALASVVWRTLRERIALATGTVVGVIVGIIPGAGAQVASILAYDQTRKFSRNNHAFGQGDPRGVIGSESANSAMVGPSLIPLLSLGLPGSPTCAVLLGALLIHGIFPGPHIFTTSGDVIWAFLGALLLGQVVIFFLGLLLARSGCLVTRVPNELLAAGILVLSVIGTFSIQHNVGDVIIMGWLGVLAYVGAKAGFPPAPMALGVILGPIAEGNFQMGRTIAAAGDGTLQYFTSGTLCLVLMGLCLASLAYGLLMPGRIVQSAHSDRLPVRETS